MVGDEDGGGQCRGGDKNPCDVTCFLRVSFVGLYGEERRMGGEASSGSHSQDVSMPWPAKRQCARWENQKSPLHAHSSGLCAVALGLS
jgi:hypothetical protein